MQFQALCSAVYLILFLMYLYLAAWWNGITTGKTSKQADSSWSLQEV